MANRKLPDRVRDGINQLNGLSVDDLIQLAQSGDKQAARTLLAKFNDILWYEAGERERGATPIGNNPNREKIKAYISECIGQSLKNDDANIGFNFAKKTKGRRSLNYRQKREQFRMALDFNELVADGISQTQAKKRIAEKYHVSEDLALDLYQYYFRGWN